MIINRDELRVEFSLSRVRKEENKAMFDLLYRDSTTIEQVFGARMDWRRLEDKKAAIVGYAGAFAAHDRETWPEAIEWLVFHVAKLHAAFAPRIPSLRALVKDGVGKAEFSN